MCAYGMCFKRLLCGILVIYILQIWCPTVHFFHINFIVVFFSVDLLELNIGPTPVDAYTILLILCTGLHISFIAQIELERCMQTIANKKIRFMFFLFVFAGYGFGSEDAHEI